MSADDNESDSERQAPGWEAIDQALDPIYGDQEPMHYGTVLPYSLGGNDPLHGISAYKVREPRPYWHFITYGFSELWQKENDDPETSGYGFELTLRVACLDEEEQPPFWALNFLQNLGRYVFETGNRFGVGHSMSLNGPICADDPTLIQAIAFARDPQLGEIDTPHGSVLFLQVMGLTSDELDAVQEWNAAKFLELYAEGEPWLITDLRRESSLTQPAFSEQVRRLTREEGSSCGWISAAGVSVNMTGQQVAIHLQTIAVDGLKRRLRGRLPYGRPLSIACEELRVTFGPGEVTAHFRDETVYQLTLSPECLTELLARLEPRRGDYPIPGLPSVILRVDETAITNSEGRVVKVV